MAEQRPIPGSTEYLVDADGELWLKTADGLQQLPQHLSGKYPAVTLRDSSGQGRSHRVHVLVALAFLGPCPQGMEVLHWDDDPMNKKLSNLRYGTRGDNLRDAVRNGRKAVGEACTVSVLKEGEVVAARQLLMAGIGTTEAARRLNLPRAAVRGMVRGASWLHLDDPPEWRACIERKFVPEGVLLRPFSSRFPRHYFGTDGNIYGLRGERYWPMRPFDKVYGQLVDANGERWIPRLNDLYRDIWQDFA